MSKPRYVVQLMGANGYEKPHWMNIAHRATQESAEAEREWLVTHGYKPDSIRIVRI
ncbi:MAG: hypothetical protein IJX67_05990 [Oscillospiraceae bacterium]|nr:hypothetical protein [Oscillospiraceae bacterium]